MLPIIIRMIIIMIIIIIIVITITITIVIVETRTTMVIHIIYHHHYTSPELLLLLLLPIIKLIINCRIRVFPTLLDPVCQACWKPLQGHLRRGEYIAGKLNFSSGPKS